MKVVFKTTISISPWAKSFNSLSVSSVMISMSKSGYTLIGCVGINVSGSGSTLCNVVEYSVSGSGIYVRCRNTHSSSHTWTIYATGLFIKNL